MPVANEDRAAVFDLLRTRLLERKQTQRPLIAGITGIDASGKTEFATAFAARLDATGLRVQLVHLDDFHHPKVYRYAGAVEPNNYYERSFDLDRLVDGVLRPVREDHALDTELELLDLATDRKELRRRYVVDGDTFVVVEGVFLLRPELRPHLDFVVFLDVPFDVARARAHVRDAPAGGDTVLRKYETKYFPAQRRYLEAVDPYRNAEVVVDNADWRRPRIVRDAPHTRRYDAIVFDLWNTLVPLPPALRERAFAAVSAALGIDPEQLRPLWVAARSERETLELESTVRQIAERAGGAAEAASVAAALAARRHIHAEAFAAPDPDAEETLAALRAAGLRIGVLSNCTSDAVGLLHDSPLAAGLDAAVFSCTTGRMKPDPEVYREVARKLHARPDRCLYVGDGHDEELDGARAAGMTAVLIEREHSPEDWSGLRIRRLDEVLTLLGEREE